MLPEKKWLLLITFLSIIAPIQYIILTNFPPENFVFAGFGYDDLVMLTTMRSIQWNFESPWIISGERGNIFSSPAYSSIYILIPLGYISLFLNMDMRTILVIAKFFAAILFLFSSYYLVKQLTKSKKEQDTSLFVFFFVAGLGGLLYVIFRLLTDPAQLFTPFPMHGFGIGAFRNIGTLYYPLSLATAFLSILFFIKQKLIKTGILLGLTVLFYPLYAFATFVVVIIYAMVNKVRIKNFIKILIISIPFSIPWIMSYIQNPFLFSQYSTLMRAYTGEFLLSLIISCAIPFTFILYNLNSEFKENLLRRKMVILWTISIILFSLSQLSQSYHLTHDPIVYNLVSDLNLFSLLNIVSKLHILFELPLFVLILKFIMEILKNEKIRKEKNNLFLILWLAIMFAFSIASPKYTFWIPGKLIAFLWFPVALLSARGILQFIARYNVSLRKILTIIFILSLPSLFFFYAFEQMMPRLGFKSFGFSSDEENALRLLEKMPNGIVLASSDMGAYIPFYANKKALLGPYPPTTINFEEKKLEKKKFFSNKTTLLEKLDILKKYNITYVFCDEKTNAMRLPYLERVYENKAKVYKVKREFIS